MPKTIFIYIFGILQLYLTNLFPNFSLKIFLKGQLVELFELPREIEVYDMIW